MWDLEGTAGLAQDTARPSAQHEGDLFVPKGQRAGIRNKDRRQRKREMGKGTQERGGGKEQGREGRVLFGEDKGLPLDGEERDLTHRKRAVYKGKRSRMLGCAEFGLGMLIL